MHGHAARPCPKPPGPGTWGCRRKLKFLNGDPRWVRERASEVQAFRPAPLSEEAITHLTARPPARPSINVCVCRICLRFSRMSCLLVQRQADIHPCCRLFAHAFSLALIQFKGSWFQSRGRGGGAQQCTRDRKPAAAVDRWSAGR